MRSRVFAALQRHPALARPVRRKQRDARPAASTPQAPPADALPRLAPRPPRFKTPRLLKMSSRAWRTAAISPEVRVPYLRLSGRWLEELGFAIGDAVLVSVEQGRVILTNSAAAMPGDPAAHV